MKTEQAVEKLKMLKAIIERLNSQMVILINTASQVEILIKKNDPSERKYTLLEQKIDALIQSYNNNQTLILN